MSRHTFYIIKQESVLISWARDASSFVLFIALIGVGIWFESSALQWVGAFVALVILLSRTKGVRKFFMSADAAIAEIERIKEASE